MDLAAGLPATSADPDQVQQLIINLLNNAVQAMTASPAPRTLRITTRMQTPAVLLIAMEDSGPGVPPELQSRIFEPFFTTKPAGAGTGLGLSIAHSIMAEHHGRIPCDRSTLGGAAFHLEFPVSAWRRRRRPSRKTPPCLRPGRPGRPGVRARPCARRRKIHRRAARRNARRPGPPAGRLPDPASPPWKCSKPAPLTSSSPISACPA